MQSTAWELSEGVVEFPNGVRVRGRGLANPTPSSLVPEFGLLLQGGQPPSMPWPTEWIKWPDFRLPTDRQGTVNLLADALDRAGRARVEVACTGGIGRTGTALGVMAVLAGVDRRDAVAWVRANYHHRATETPWQRRWVRRFDTS